MEANARKRLLFPFGLDSDHLKSSKEADIWEFTYIQGYEWVKPVCKGVRCYLEMLIMNILHSVQSGETLICVHGKTPRKHS